MDSSFDRSKAVKAGDTLPDFALSDSAGKLWRRDDFLTDNNNSGLLINFQRGGWCPFCNVELRAYQKILPQLQEKAVTLIAITPDAIQDASSRKKQMGLEFTVLSDPDNGLARQLGCVAEQPETMRPMLEGADERFKSGKPLEVPVPATILVDGRGVVRETFVNSSYHERLEPETALGWIERLQR